MAFKKAATLQKPIIVMQRLKSSLLSFLMLFCCFYSLKAQQPGSIFDKLAGMGDLLEIEIQTDLTLLRAQKNTNDYQPAVFSYATGKKERENWDIKIRSRGKYRRRICQFPPLKLNFPKDVLKEKGFNKDDEFKLITHCVEGDPGKEYLLREYLVYKLCHALEMPSFQVQLCKVRYIDPVTKEKINAWGIIMEDEATLARKFDAKICEDCYSPPLEAFRANNVQEVFLFEYMIGNTDWSFNMLRNMLMLQPKDGSPAILLPYDFDFSGFVNASYARPNADFGQTSVRQRLFLGKEISDESLAPAIERFKSKRKALEDEILGFKYLDVASRNDLLAFIRSFYDSLGSGIQRPSDAKQ